MARINIESILKIMLTIMLVFAISACSTMANNKRISKQVDSDAKRVTDINQKVYKKLKAKPKPIKKVVIPSLPKWSKEKVSLDTGSVTVTLEQAMDVLFSGNNMVIAYSDESLKKTPLHLNYKGTLHEVLEKIAFLVDYSFEYQGDDIYWHQYLTKSIHIPFVPGTQDFKVGTSIAKATDNKNLFNEQNNGTEYSNLSGSIDIWTEIDTTIKPMLSPKGKLTIAPAFTRLVITDKPSVVRKVTKEIREITSGLTKQVMVKVIIAQVQLDNDNNIGINWDAVSSYLGTSLQLTGTLGALVTNTTSSTLTASSPGSGSAVLNALEQYAKTSLITEPMLTTTNNQLVELSVNKELGYLAGKQDTITQNGNIVTAIKSSQVVEGLKIFILPNIFEDKVFMQVSTTLSDLIEINSIKEGDLTILQTPIVDTERFNSRAVIQSGQTLILSGFRNKTAKSKKGKLFGMSLLGGEGSDHFDHELVFLITPVIVDINEAGQVDTLENNPYFIP